MTRLQAILTIVFLAFVPSFAAAPPQTFISLDSQPGDWVGQGQQYNFTPADGTFTVQGSSNSITVAFNTSDFSQFWYLTFSAPTGQALTRSVYEGAQRAAFHAPPKPGIDVSGDGRGCNTDTGRFLVSDVAFAQDGTVERLAVDFEQHCEDAPPALFGSVRYNSSVTAVPRVSVADATALKGNTGTNDATLILSLSLPSNQIVTVNYATVDGTAVAGTDYVSTAGTAEFQPGTTSQTITVPIIGDHLARGNKAFQVRLSSPTGAPPGDVTAKVNIFDPNVPMTVLDMYSQPGDPFGNGQILLFTVADGTFTPSRNFDNGVSATLSASSLWLLDFAGPNNQTLTPGNYENAQRYPFQDPSVPGMDIAGEGIGCNTVTGRFTVTQASYQSNGDVRRFGVDFEQLCDGATPALFGSLRINSVLRQLSVSDAVIDSGSSSSVFTVTLNPTVQRTISVKFKTADGTAIRGVDYTATSQTVTFAPGDSEHTVTVPLLTNGGGQKQFFGQLSAPNGAPVWISQGSATF